MDEHYPAKIVDHFLADIKIDLTEIKTGHSKSIDDLKNTISSHNGRLSRVEQFMWAFGGGMAVVTMLVLPYSFYYMTKIDEKVERIDKTLSGYNVQVE